MLMPAASGVGSGVVATTLVMGTLGLSRGGFSVNHMDIAPKYAGIVMGVSNTAGAAATRRGEGGGLAHGVGTGTEVASCMWGDATNALLLGPSKGWA